VLIADGGGSGATPTDEEVLRAVNPALASVLYEPESMSSFKARVDELIVKLNGSPAGPDKVAEEPVTRSQFGGEAWAEAAGLFNAYDTVVDQLKQLSQLLADSMEGMGIAVRSSQVGYEDLEADIRRRMLAIHENTQKHYDPKLDPSAQEEAKGQAPAQAQPGDTSGDSTAAGGL